MEILFCDDAFDSKSVDPDFEVEYKASRENGFAPHLFSYEILTKEGDAEQATRRIKKADRLRPIVYRGWMLKPDQYSALYDTLLVKGYKLINTAEEYKNCHYLPESYRFIETETPRTVWLPMQPGDANYAKIFEIISVFGDSPLIVKDYVKSQKHYWETACYIDSAVNSEKVRSVIGRFLELQGTDLNEGLVIREFVELEELTKHSKSGMPLKLEYRLFYLQGKLIGCYEYWEEGVYSSEEIPPMESFQKIAETIESNFFSMDIAKTKAGEWIIVELGDGQVAGLPDSAEKNEFYKSMFDRYGS
jgi:hypothetical protein